MLIHGGFAPPASWEPEDSLLSQVKAFPERRGGFSFKYPSHFQGRPDVKRTMEVFVNRIFAVSTQYPGHP